MNRVRVLIVDDLKTVRDGLRSILELHDEIEVVGEAEDGQQAVSLSETLRPHVVVMDVRMPVMDGIAATHQIINRNLADTVIILTIDNSLQNLTVILNISLNI